MKKVIHIVGARPNFIKAAPLIKSMNKLDIHNLVIHTGQHYDHNMSQQFFSDLNIPTPYYNLGAGGGSHATQTANIMIGCERVFVEHKPDLIIVYGDINSCVSAALVAKKLHLDGLPSIKIAHIEAGLRSFDMEMPEEVNRIVTDSITDLFFVTCKDALHNLEKQGTDMKKCFFVGNTMIDSLIEFNDKFDLSKVLDKYSLTKGSYALCTLHRPSNVDSKEDLIRMFDAIVDTSKILKCVFPIHPRTKSNLSKYNLYEKYNNIPNLCIIEPQGYIDFMCLQKNAKLVITDSGGIQEESSFFGIPCLTVRDNTERPVTVTQGTNTLIGSNYENIPKMVSNTHSTESNIELWDGASSDRIIEILMKELNNE